MNGELVGQGIGIFVRASQWIRSMVLVLTLDRLFPSLFPGRCPILSSPVLRSYRVATVEYYKPLLLPCEAIATSSGRRSHAPRVPLQPSCRKPKLFSL